MILSMGIWEEEYNIAIGSDIHCVIYKDTPSTRLAKKKDSSSKDELAP